MSKQKQASSFMFDGDRNVSGWSLLKYLNSLNVYQTKVFEVLIFMHKITKGIYPQIFLKHVLSI